MIKQYKQIINILIFYNLAFTLYYNQSIQATNDYSGGGVEVGGSGD